ncbi:VENN motif pre-toxin domain-containing protein, partial [Gilliamella sp. wkB108]
EKDNISALTQLAVGLTIASMGGDESDITTGVNSSKNAVENNWMVQAAVISWRVIRTNTIGQPVTITAVDVLVGRGLSIAEAESFLTSLTLEQRKLIDLALVDPMGDSNFENAVLKTYDRYGNANQLASESNDKSINSIINDNTLSNTEITSDIANNQIIEKDWQDYFLKNNNKIEEEWHEGAEGKSADSLLKHYNKHGKELKSDSPEHYLNQAKEFAKNLRGARVVKNVKGYTQNVTRYYKNGKYIDIAADKRIVSFGKQ